MRKLIKRGEANVVSIILLILITITAWSLVFIWARSLIFGSTQSLENEAKFWSNIVDEKPIIEDVWFFAKGKIKIYVANLGRLDITIDTIFINGTLISTKSYRLLPYEGTWIEINYNWTRSEAYKIIISTRRGVSYETEVKA